MDITKLPKWAQELIAGQCQKIDDLEQEISILKSGEKTNIEVDCYNRTTGPSYAHDYAAIRFKLDKFRSVTVRFDEKKQSVLVNTEARQTSIIPRASNCFEIKVED